MRHIVVGEFSNNASGQFDRYDVASLLGANGSRNASSQLDRYDVASILSKSVLGHLDDPTPSSNKTAVSTEPHESMSDTTRWIITVSILVVSVLIFYFLRSLKVSVDDAKTTAGEEPTMSSMEEAATVPSPRLGRDRSVSPPGGALSRDRSLSPEGKSSRRCSGGAQPGEDSVASELLFISYGRLKDQQIIASHVPGEGKGKASEKNFEDDASNLLKLAKKKNYKPGSKDKLDNKKRECRILYIIDDKGEYMATMMVPVKFPESTAYRYLFDLQAAAKKHADEARTCEKGGLNIALLVTMEEMCSPPSEQNRRATTTTTRASQCMGAINVLEKMDAIKDSIRQNVAIAQENDATLRNLQGNTKRMDNAAQAFKDDAEVAKWKHTLERYKFWAYVGVFIIDAISIWVVWSV